MTDNSIEKSKQELIAEIDKRIEDKIIEQSNADLLKKLINNADSLTEAISIAELGTTYKRTGLHFDKRLEKFDDTVKYFKKNTELSFETDKNKTTHKLIIGDNYDALLNLLVEYKGRIDVIYIDPPYGKDSMGEFAQTNYENAITRDNLLSMLYPRLVLARQLLSDEGVIFCSIDDKNQAYLKCLFDEVFGESNFVSDITVVTDARVRNYNVISPVHEYLLLYTKSGNYSLIMQEDEDKEFAYQDDDGNFDLYELRNRNAQFNNQNRPNLFYPFYLNETNVDENGLYEISLTPQAGFIEVLPQKSGDIQTVWRQAKQTVEPKLNIEIFGKKSKNGFQIVKKYRGITKSKSTVWNENIYLSDRGALELRNIFGKKFFDFPKPVCLIEDAIKLSAGKSAIILDFFAGSGTTGQAVLELNKQDGGNRQFILATANEITDTTPNGVVNDVTSKRLKRVMTGECYDKTNNFKWLEKNKPLGDNLAVYDINTVSPFESHESKTPFDVIDETLYGKEKMSVADKIKWVCENFDGTQKLIEKDSDYNKRIGGAD